MPYGSWPPHILGSDVVYLVNFFRNLSQPCVIDGFYAAADINGDCHVIGSDVTYLVNYFRGMAPSGIHYCPDYPPAWENQFEVPDTRPDGWPPCETYLLKAKPGDRIIAPEKEPGAGR